MMAIRGSKNGRQLIVAVAVAVALTSALAACGSDDGDSEGDSKQATAPAVPTTDRGRLAALLNDLQASFIAVDGKRFCGHLTRGGQAEVVRYGKAVSMPGSCPAIITKISKATRDAGVKQRPSRMLSARINGKKATALVKDANRRPEPMHFVKVDGSWKLPSPGLEDTLKSENLR